MARLAIAKIRVAVLPMGLEKLAEIGAMVLVITGIRNPILEAKIAEATIPRPMPIDPVTNGRDGYCCDGGM